MFDRSRSVTFEDESLEIPDEEAALIAFLHVCNLLAEPHGGAVILLSGNHEFMNRKGKFGASAYARKTSAGRLDRKEFQKDGRYGKLLNACGFLPAVQIGPLLAIHGGILPSLAGQAPSDQDLLTFLRELQDASHDPKTQDLPETCALRKKWFEHGESVMWTRQFSTNTRPTDCGLVGEVLRTLPLNLKKSSAVSTILVGHTSQVHRTSPAFEFHTITQKDPHRIVLSGTASKLPSRAKKRASGICFECMQPNANPAARQAQIPGLVMLDCSMSRAFDSKYEIRDAREGKISRAQLRQHLRLRRPQAAVFEMDEKGVVAMCVAVARKGLKRNWTKEFGIEDQD